MPVHIHRKLLPWCVWFRWTYFVCSMYQQGLRQHQTLVTHASAHLASLRVRPLAVTCIGVITVPIIHKHFVEVNHADITGERLLREPSRK